MGAMAADRPAFGRWWSQYFPSQESVQHTHAPVSAARHELAHSFGDFGEEYDGALGGEDYSGANFARSTRRCAEGELPSASPSGEMSSSIEAGTPSSLACSISLLI